jgi:hypothetical protein
VCVGGQDSVHRGRSGFDRRQCQRLRTAASATIPASMDGIGAPRRLARQRSQRSRPYGSSGRRYGFASLPAVQASLTHRRGRSSRRRQPRPDPSRSCWIRSTGSANALDCGVAMTPALDGRILNLRRLARQRSKRSRPYGSSGRRYSFASLPAVQASLTHRRGQSSRCRQPRPDPSRSCWLRSTGSANAPGLRRRDDSSPRRPDSEPPSVGTATVPSAAVPTVQARFATGFTRGR